jgi:predicted Zn-dependent protease
MMRIAFYLLIPLLMLGCASSQVRDFESSSDASRLTEGEGRMWHEAGKMDEVIRKRRLIYDSPRVTAYVQGIVDRLYPEFKETIRVRLFNSPDLNAFVLPNGSIYVNIGLLGRMENEAQLATVLAHEVSHFKFQHALKQRSNVDAIFVAGVGVEVLTGIPLTGTLLINSVLSNYSQSHEREADQEGFRRLVAAGYDPAEAAKTFEILLQEVKTLDIDQPYMFSSHPRLEERIASFQGLAANSDHRGARRNRAAFLQRTEQVREDILERYLALHRYKTLIQMLENGYATDRYPDYARFYLGEAYRQRGEEEDAQLAEQAYRRAMAAAPGFAPSYRGLGVLQLKQGNRSAALKNLRKYLAMAPDAADRGYVEAYIDSLQKENQ